MTRLIESHRGFFMKLRLYFVWSMLFVQITLGMENIKDYLPPTAVYRRNAKGKLVLQGDTSMLSASELEEIKNDNYTYCPTFDVVHQSSKGSLAIGAVVLGMPHSGVCDELQEFAHKSRTE